MINYFIAVLFFITVYGTQNHELFKDLECNCDWRYLQHYETKGCHPVYAEKLDNGRSECTCPRRFNCSQFDADLNDAEEDEIDYRAKERYPGVFVKTSCVYKNQDFPVGSKIPITNLCTTCSCTFDHFTPSTFYAKIHCCECLSEDDSAPIPKDCHKIYKEKDCCPTVECYVEENQNTYKAKKDDQRLRPPIIKKLPMCEYKGRMYYEGERIYPDEDPCLTCSCNSNWTGINSINCWQQDCMLEMYLWEFKQGCIPIYHEEECCTFDYHCTKYGLDKPNIKSEEEEKMCYFDGQYYPIGHVIDIKHHTNCVNCTCKVPPDFTCIHRSCPPPPNNDYKNCKPKRQLHSNACCPDWKCKRLKKKVITATEDCDADINLLCRYENAPDKFPETENDFLKVCENAIGRFECMVKYKTKCDNNQKFEENSKHFIQWSHAKDFLNAFEEICNEDTVSYAVVVDNLMCYKRFGRKLFFLFTKCLSQIRNDSTAATYTRALDQMMIDRENYRDKLNEINNATICTDYFLVTSCLLMEMEEMCGSLADNIFRMFLDTLVPKSGCLRIDLLTEMIISYRVQRFEENLDNIIQVTFYNESYISIEFDDYVF